MKLIIDGKLAVLKSGSSFDYVLENRAFSDADDYSMSITLPLAGCPENLAIFGQLNRIDSNSRYTVLEAAIVDSALSRFGVVTVVEANETEVKCQFLEGRSVQNFLTVFDDIYINELNLGAYPSGSLPANVNYGDIDHGAESVALPWVNDSSNGYLNNAVVVDNGVFKWADSTKSVGKLSYMPYLLSIAKAICREVGYTFDFSEWEESDDRFLLICNVLPASWDRPQFARALPHWSVTEFFEELEKILVCEIDIDHRNTHISLTFCQNISESRPIVKIDEVLDSFSSEISYTDELCQFKGVANLRYADRGDASWKVEQCQWLIDLLKSDGKYYFEYDEEDFMWLVVACALSDFPKDEARDPELGGVIYSGGKYYLAHILETTMYYVDGSSRICHPMSWGEINRFGDVINHPESDTYIELRMLPARVDYTSKTNGLCVFLAPSGFNEKEELDSAGIRQPMGYSALMKGKPDQVAEYFDKIYLAFWDGHSANESDSSGGKLPACPSVDSRLNLKKRYQNYLNGIKVDPREKMKFSWLSTSVPDVRAIFHIKGKRYLCEKITATFTEDGMSQLLKGEFYPIL